MLDYSLSDWLDLPSTNELRDRLEEAFDLLELSKNPCNLDKEEYISDLLEQKYVDGYSYAVDSMYEEFKNEGFKGEKK